MQSLRLTMSSLMQLPQPSPATHLRTSSSALPTGRGAVEKPLRMVAAAPTTPRISETFSKLRERGKVGFIPYITAGDPDLSATAEALRILDGCGATAIELGLPFSDPFLDGAVIQASNKRALSQGATLDGVMSMLQQVRPQLSCPICLFTYYNLILSCGESKFLAMIRDAGVKGLIVPDLPFELSDSLRHGAVHHNIELVLMTTPTTGREKMEAIVSAAEGFVYLVSTTGVTGARATVDPRVPSLIQQIKQVTDKPVAVGFGISKPEHVKQVAEWGADGVIVGSAIVRALGEAGGTKAGLAAMADLVVHLTATLP